MATNAHYTSEEAAALLEIEVDEDGKRRTDQVVCEIANRTKHEASNDLNPNRNYTPRSLQDSRIRRRKIKTNTNSAMVERMLQRKYGNTTDVMGSSVDGGGVDVDMMMEMGSPGEMGMTEHQPAVQQTYPLAGPLSRPSGPSRLPAQPVQHMNRSAALERSAHPGYSNPPITGGSFRTRPDHHDDHHEHHEKLKVKRQQAQHEHPPSGQAQMQISTLDTAPAGPSFSRGRQNPTIGGPGAPQRGGMFQDQRNSYGAQGPQSLTPTSMLVSPYPLPSSMQQGNTQNFLPPMRLPPMQNQAPTTSPSASENPSISNLINPNYSPSPPPRPPRQHGHGGSSIGHSRNPESERRR